MNTHQIPGDALEDTASEAAFERWKQRAEDTWLAQMAFTDGARWFAAGMAVCAFLADLAAQVNACRPCGGRGEVPSMSGPYMTLCRACRGYGKRRVRP